MAALRHAWHIQSINFNKPSKCPRNGLKSISFIVTKRFMSVDAEKCTMRPTNSLRCEWLMNVTIVMDV